MSAAGGEAVTADATPPAVRATSVGTHYLRYSTANIAVLLAGFVSFPILTRLLDNTQYGILGYYETWIALSVAVLKFGAQHSVMRLYPHGADAARLRHFATNMVLFPILGMLAGWSVVAISVGVSAAWGGFRPNAVLVSALFLVPLVAISSLMDIVLQASERSMLLMVTRVCKRWLELGLVLLCVLAIDRSALAVYGGKLAAGALVVAFYASWLARNMQFSWKVLDAPAIRASMAYGLPLVANELAWVLLDSLDRVLLKHLLGSFAAVGVYTIGYSLAINVRLFMSSTLLEAFVPVANRQYETSGAASVVALKDKILMPMTYASIGGAVLLLGVGQEALVALSGPDKAGSGIVFVAVGVAFAIYPLVSVSGYGLLLHKRSMLTFWLTLAAVALNIALNLVLVPRLGIMGAVWAAVASYAAVALLNFAFCPAQLRRLPQPRSLAIGLVLGAVALAAIELAKPGLAHPWQSLLVAGALFATLYAAPAWLFDHGLRATLRGWRKQEPSVR
jgi:O-antigen/teichoic acid export membrane protein